jgi:hypothetical protein
MMRDIKQPQNAMNPTTSISDSISNKLKYIRTKFPWSNILDIDQIF